MDMPRYNPASVCGVDGSFSFSFRLADKTRGPHGLRRRKKMRGNGANFMEARGIKVYNNGMTGMPPNNGLAYPTLLHDAITGAPIDAKATTLGDPDDIDEFEQSVKNLAVSATFANNWCCSYCACPGTKSKGEGIP